MPDDPDALACEAFEKWWVGDNERWRDPTTEEAQIIWLAAWTAARAASQDDWADAERFRFLIERHANETPCDFDSRYSDVTFDWSAQIGSRETSLADLIRALIDRDREGV